MKLLKKIRRSLRCPVGVRKARPALKSRAHRLKPLWG